MHRLSWLLLLAALGLFLAACGGTPQPDPYTVAGTIADSNGSPLEGVNVSFGDAAEAVTTDADGKWQRTNLHGDVIVTPTHADFAFAPKSQTVSEAADDVNFTALRLFTGAGTVFDDGGDRIPNVTINLEHADLSKVTTTDASGKWEQPGLYGTVTVTPEDPAYTFSPPTQELSAAATTANFEGELRACNEGDPTSKVEPCVISRVRQLQQLGVEGHYALGADMDASATRDWNGGEGFEPIGTETAEFAGSFDGRGHAITGLFISRSTAEGVGLFGYTGEDSEIDDLTLTDVDIKGDKFVGGLVGVNSRGAISGVHVTGSVAGAGFTVGGVVGENKGGGSIERSSSAASVSGTGRVGGLVGSHTYSPTIKESYSSGEVTGTGGYVGGLVGYTDSGGIEDSHSSATVIGAGGVGGLVGALGYDRVINSYSTGDVSGVRDVGGLVGQNNRGEIEASYSIGDVNGEENVGGLVGQNTNLGKIEASYSMSTTTGEEKVGGLVGHHESGSIGESYSTGLVTGTASIGGLIGDASAGTTTTDSYWDIGTSGQAASAAGTGKATAEMKQQGTFTNWDFTSVWMISEGTDYPDLQDNPR